MSSNRNLTSSLPKLAAATSALATTALLMATQVLDATLEGPALVVGYIACIGGMTAAGYYVGRGINECCAEHDGADNFEYLTQEIEKIENEKNNELLLSQIKAALDVKLLTATEVADYKKLIDTTLPVFSACEKNEALNLYLQSINSHKAYFNQPLTITDKTTGVAHTFEASIFVKSYIQDRIQEQINFEGKPLNTDNFNFSSFCKNPRTLEDYLAGVRAMLYPQPDLAPQPASLNRDAFFSVALAKEKQRLMIARQQNQAQVYPLEISDSQALAYARMV